MRNTIITNNGYYIDSNNNKWSTEKYSLEEATQASASLKGCHHCTDCEHMSISCMCKNLDHVYQWHNLKANGADVKRHLKKGCPHFEECDKKTCRLQNYRDFDVILVCGAPGSGKSTLAEKLVARDIADTWVEADDFFLNEEGVYNFDPKKLATAHQYCFDQFKEAVNNHLRVVVSNTFTMKWERENYLNFARKHNLKIGYVHCENIFENTHGVPKDKVESVRERFESFSNVTPYRTHLEDIVIYKDNSTKGDKMLNF